MLNRIATHPFNAFNREALSPDERAVLDGGISKHQTVLKYLCVFLLPQLALAFSAPEVFVILTAVSFVALMLGGAWYSISFQNVSADQLDAGVADFITQKMFRAFALCFTSLIICTMAFMVKSLIPEAAGFEADLPLWFRVTVLVTNLIWLGLVWLDVYWASICYDAADSLLGDGFPTLMRGAKANHENLPMVTILVAIAKKLGVEDPETLLVPATKSEE